MLKGGDPVIQRSFYNKLQTAEMIVVFFKVFHDKMSRRTRSAPRSARQHRNPPRSVNTAEIAGGGHNKDNANQGKNKREDSGADLATESMTTSTLEDQRTPEIRSSSTSNESTKLSAKVLAMLPVIRFLQLLCENHNRNLQDFLRAQSNKNSYNFVSETRILLDCICGRQRLGLYINERSVALINQTLEMFT